MEHLSVQDIERNSLAAEFLRALEYFKGVLFLTTNRVGHFDEALISRINITIYYSPFNELQRRALWESCFKKLQKEREDKMRIQPQHQMCRGRVGRPEEAGMEWPRDKNGKSTDEVHSIALTLEKPSRLWLPSRKRKGTRMNEAECSSSQTTSKPPCICRRTSRSTWRICTLEAKQTALPLGGIDTMLSGNLQQMKQHTVESQLGQYAHGLPRSSLHDV